MKVWSDTNKRMMTRCISPVRVSFGTVPDTIVPGLGNPQSHPRMLAHHECTNYGARHSCIRDRRFVDGGPDTIVPNPGDPQALNRYSAERTSPKVSCRSRMEQS